MKHLKLCLLTLLCMASLVCHAVTIKVGGSTTLTGPTPGSSRGAIYTWSPTYSAYVGMMPSSSGSTCKVTGEKAGSVTISCTVKWQTYDSTTGLYVYASSNKKTQTYSVIVQAADDTTPTSISLNYTSVSLEVGNTRQLSATVSPSGASQSVTWSVVSGSGVASVSSSGLVTALATGTATIRATSSAKSSVYKDCTVTVIQTTPPTSISLNYTSISLTEGDTRQLTATVNPSGASQSVTWSVYSGSSYASVSSSGLVTAKAAGTATIRATSTANSSVYKDCTVTVTEPVLTPGTWSGNTVTIGDNATSSTSKAPYNNYWTYSTTQMLYSPAEIGGSGTINSIAFKVASASSFTTTALKVYLGHKSSLFSSTTDYMTSSNLTLVYDGTPTLGASSGWETLTFNKGTFDYNGTDNLVVVVAMKSSNYDTTLGYYCYTGSGYVLSRGSDSTTGYGDITSTSYAYSTSTERPSIKIGFGQSQGGTTDIEINATNFPDANFRSYLLSQSYGSDGILTQDEINGVTELKVGNKQIGSLKGIEHFTALTQLSCVGNQLTTLDVSKNIALTSLICTGNMLTTLDVSNSTVLTELACGYNQLATLDVSKNTALTILYCHENQLTTLDVSRNTALKELYCRRNQLTSLKVPKNTALTRIDCYGNQLTTLDVSKNTALTILYCYNNQLTTLDVSDDTALTDLHCYKNQLTTLDVSKNTALRNLYCYNNQLTTLDVSKNSALTSLSCYGNQLTTLDLSESTDLANLGCQRNQLTSLDVSENTKLITLSCDSNQLTSLDVSKNTALGRLFCRKNNIKGMNMDNLIAGLRKADTNNLCAFYVIDASGSNEEGNVCTKAQVAAIKAKGWKPYYYDGSRYYEYEGSEEEVVYSDGDTFSATNSDGVTLNYQVISAQDKTVRIIPNYNYNYKSEITGAFRIPNEVNGFHVVEIGKEAFGECYGMTSLLIPKSITTINGSAFYGCSALSSIIVENGNTTYDSRNDCNGIIETATNKLIVGCLTTKIPDSVTSIGEDAFAENKNLKEIQIPGSVVSIDDYAFDACESLNKVTLSQGLKTIGSKVFRGTSISEIEFPSSVESIGYKAFYNCLNLKVVKSNIQVPFYLDESVFKNSQDDDEVSVPVPASAPVNVPSDLKSKLKVNTENCYITYNEATLYVPRGTKALYEATAGWNQFTNIVEMESGVLNDGDTFSATNSDGLTLKYYVISAADKIVSVTSASKTATHISIPAEVNGFRVIEIGSSLAQGNTNLKTVVIPEGISRITREAFLDCISLTSLYIPASVTSIKPSSFHGCINLREVVVADDNPVYDSRENCNGIIETATNTLFFGNRNTVIPQSVTAIGSFSATGDVVIPSQITVIGEDAFMFMEGMTSVTIPAGVTAIGRYAFEDCSGLTSVTSLITSPFAIDESVFRNHGHNPSATLYVPVGTKALYEATAGWNQFPNIVEKEAEEEPQTFEVDGIYYKIAKASDALNGIEQTIYQSDVEVAVVCEAEKGHEYSGDIVIPSSITYDGKTYPVACVAGCAFAEYKGWNGKEIRSVVIPNSVVAIGEEAFVESGTLRRVEIPNSVRYIGEDAFADCESLSEIVSYIQEPFEIQTNVFRNIANDATLYVPFGTKALYEATVGWNGIANIVEMEPAEIVVTDVSQLENAIYIEPLTSRVGTTVDLCVKMKNTLTPVGCSFKLTLPQGLRLQEDEYGDVVYEMGSRAKKMSVTMQDWDDGSYDFALTPSTATAIISGNDDTFITFHVELPDDMEATDYALLLTRCLIQSRTDGMTKDFPLSNVTSRLTVEDYLMGDVNNDGSVTPSDAIMTLYNYFSVEQTGFNAKAADMNSDASITPADAIEMLYTYFGSGRQNVTRRNGDEREPQ